MASAAVHPGDVAPAARRDEVLEWYASLSTRTDAELLGVRAGARASELKAAFATLARRFHPDTAGPEESDLRAPLQAIFVRVTEAHRNLAARTFGGVYAPAPWEAQPAAARGARTPQDAPRPERQERQASAPRSVASDAEERRTRVKLALRSAEELVARGQADEAVAVLHEVLTQADAPRRRRIRLLLARAYAADVRRRRYAVQLLRELVEQDTSDAEALAELAELYRREGLPARAEPLFARAVSLDPGLAAARDGLRAVRAVLAARQSPTAREAAPRRGLLARLFPVAR